MRVQELTFILRLANFGELRLIQKVYSSSYTVSFTFPLTYLELFLYPLQSNELTFLVMILFDA